MAWGHAQHKESLRPVPGNNDCWARRRGDCICLGTSIWSPFCRPHLLALLGTMLNRRVSHAATRRTRQPIALQTRGCAQRWIVCGPLGMSVLRHTVLDPSAACQGCRWLSGGPDRLRSSGGRSHCPLCVEDPGRHRDAGWIPLVFNGKLVAREQASGAYTRTSAMVTVQARFAAWESTVIG